LKHELEDLIEGEKEEIEIEKNFMLHRSQSKKETVNIIVS
jgi:hypothetical protein